MDELDKQSSEATDDDVERVDDSSEAVNVIPAARSTRSSPVSATPATWS